VSGISGFIEVVADSPIGTFGLISQLVNLTFKEISRYFFPNLTIL
jgi:hypothetical protein